MLTGRAKTSGLMTLTWQWSWESWVAQVELPWWAADMMICTFLNAACSSHTLNTVRAEKTLKALGGIQSHSRATCYKHWVAVLGVSCVMCFPLDLSIVHALCHASLPCFSQETHWAGSLSHRREHAKHSIVYSSLALSIGHSQTSGTGHQSPDVTIGQGETYYGLALLCQPYLMLWGTACTSQPLCIQPFYTRGRIGLAAEMWVACLSLKWWGFMSIWPFVPILSCTPEIFCFLPKVMSDV